MSGVIRFLVGAALLMVAVVAFYKATYPSHAWRQKMTVTVATPQGEKTGSSVQAVEWTPNPFFKDGAAFHLRLQGEAVAVEIAPGRTLFALLIRPGSPEYAGLVALYRYGGSSPDSAAFPWGKTNFAAVQAAHGAGPVDLPQRLYPMLVTFRDIHDPKTVELVDPNDLAASFGPGVNLARVTIGITDVPVTTGIERYAPSYRNRDDWYEWRLKLRYGDPRQIGPEAFRTGF